MAANEARPLPFLELPKELRLMVYERLTVRREKIGINLGEPARYHRPDVIIYKESAPVAILAICKQVHQEAAPFIQALKNEILNYLPSIDAHWESPDFFYLFMKIVPLAEPAPTSDLIRMRVQEYFPFVQPVYRQAIIQVAQRASTFRATVEGHTRPRSFSFRVVHMSETSFKVYRATDNMKRAFGLLFGELCWNERRERELFTGDEDLGVATHKCTGRDIVFYCNKGWTSWLLVRGSVS